MAGDPDRAAALSQQVSTALVRYAQALKGVWVSVPETVKPAVEKAIFASQSGESFPLSGNDNDNGNANANDNDNGNANDNDNGNANDNDNGNANDNDNGNANDNDNGNANDND